MTTACIYKGIPVDVINANRFQRPGVRVTNLSPPIHAGLLVRVVHSSALMGRTLMGRDKAPY